MTAPAECPAITPRLWVYTNFDCNLHCAYCVARSGPRAERRGLAMHAFRRLVDEAVAYGIDELFITGGEPFLLPDIGERVRYAAARIPTAVHTNAMLFHGRRRRELERLARHPRLTLQSSLDGARAETHDRWRGAGSWQKAMDGIEYARELGLPLRVAMTETPDNRGEVDELRGLLAGVGVTGDGFAVRPLVQRGFAAEVPGAMQVSDAVMVPELTITADGAHWHPVGADVASSPDFLVAEGDVALGEAERRVVERFLTLRRADGSLPDAFHCAV